MTIMFQIFTNKAIMIPALAWFIAQTLKVLFVIIKDRKLDVSRFVGSGGMPSSHSSFIVSLATVTGKNAGFNSIEFAITVAISLIVMYDAAGVRRAAGKQAEVLNLLLQSFKDGMHFDKKLKELLGHSPFEVTMGALLGIFLGIVLG